jgi:outer membrane biosynthesis protein TonB
MPAGVTQVEVTVDIDARGKVTKVTPVGWNSTNAPVMIVATRAATSWTFQPAQLNGQNVSSQMNLIFKFQ